MVICAGLGITEQNFEILAAKHYDNVFYDTVEFQLDLKRFAYLKRLFNYYYKTKDLKDRLIVNHLVVIYNLWSKAATPMLFVKLSGYETLLKTFLVYMERMPDKIEEIGMDRRTVISKDIEIDYSVLKMLVDNEQQ